jgi:hypothetical protein
LVDHVQWCSSRDWDHTRTPKHVIYVEDSWSAFRTNERDGLVLGNAQAKFKKNIWIILGQVRYNDVCIKQLITIVAWITSLPSRLAVKTSKPASRRRRDEGTQDLVKESLEWPVVSLSERHEAKHRRPVSFSALPG